MKNGYLNFSEIVGLTGLIWHHLILRWISYSPKLKGFYIKDFDRIRKDNDWRAVSALEFSTKDLPFFREFIYSGVICREVKKSLKRNSRGDGSMTEHIERLNFSSLTSSVRPPYSAPISCVVMGKYLKISNDTSQRYKNRGHELGFLELYPQLFDLGLDANHLASAAENLNTKYEHVVNLHGKLFLRSVDWVVPKMVFRSRKKIGTETRDSPSSSCDAYTCEPSRVPGHARRHMRKRSSTYEREKSQPKRYQNL